MQDETTHRRMGSYLTVGGVDALASFNSAFARLSSHTLLTMLLPLLLYIRPNLLNSLYQLHKSLKIICSTLLTDAS